MPAPSKGCVVPRRRRSDPREHRAYRAAIAHSSRAPHTARAPRARTARTHLRMPPKKERCFEGLGVLKVRTPCPNCRLLIDDIEEERFDRIREKAYFHGLPCDDEHRLAQPPPRGAQIAAGAADEDGPVLRDSDQLNEPERLQPSPLRADGNRLSGRVVQVGSIQPIKLPKNITRGGASLAPLTVDALAGFPWMKDSAEVGAMGIFELGQLALAEHMLGRKRGGARLVQSSTPRARRSSSSRGGRRLERQARDGSTPTLLAT
eukprot:SAG31_NODE_1057_length_10129_cov_29.441376_2_plen_262_part_00